MNDYRINDIALQLINAASMKMDEWKFTTIGRLAERLKNDFQLKKGELVLCSFFYDTDNWYVFTTRRLVCKFENKVNTINPQNITDTDFGNAKGYGAKGQLSEQTLGKACIIAGSKKYRFMFETGYASMAPVHAVKFWQLKYPVIDKLMTISERRAYKDRKTQ